LYQYDNNATGIAGASVVLIFDVDGSPIQYLGVTNASGQCEITITTDNISTRMYNITIEFTLLAHQGSTIFSNITVILLATSGNLYSVTQPDHTGFTGQLYFDSNSNSYIGWLPYNTSIQFSYRDINNSEWINNGIGILTFNGQTYSHYLEVNGIYEWEIPTFNLVGTYPISITMSKDNWENVTFQFYITIGYKDLEITDFALSDYGHVLEIQDGSISDAYLGNDLYIQLKLKDNITGYYINQSNVILVLDGINYYATIMSGTYYWLLSTDNFAAQIYGLNITFSENYYFNHSISYTIEFLEKYIINISLFDAPESVGIGDTLSISIKLVYITLSLSLLQLSADRGCRVCKYNGFI